MQFVTDSLALVIPFDDDDVLKRHSKTAPGKFKMLFPLGLESMKKVLKHGLEDGHCVS